MSFNIISENISLVTAMFATLIVITNIITQVIKNTFKMEGIPAQVTVLCVSVILTIFTMILFMLLLGQVIFWYYYPTAVIAGFLVAYGAMYGYDNLYSELARVFKKEDKINE